MDTTTPSTSGPVPRGQVTAYVRLAPPEPPGALRRWLEPVLDDHGEVLDWTVDLGRMLATLEPGRIGQALAAHRAWQRDTHHVFAIDDLDEVRYLAHDAARLDLPLLASLDELPVVVPVESVDELDLQCQEAELLLGSIQRTCWAFVAPATDVVLRSTAVREPAIVAAGLEPVDWEIEVSPSRGPRIRLADTVYAVTGWTLTNKGVRITHPDGELDLAGPPARSLVHLAPSSPIVEVRTIDVAQAHAARLARLRAAASRAAREHTYLLVQVANT